MSNGFDYFDIQGSFRNARPDEAEKVYYVVQHTKAVIYPDYYTQAVVEFFGRLHSLDNIKSDIAQGRIGVLVKDSEIIGTGTAPASAPVIISQESMFCPNIKGWASAV